MTFAQWIEGVGAEGVADVLALLASPLQIVATLAAVVGIGLVIAGAFVRTMQPLRWLAVGSNVGMAAFGAIHPSMTTLVVAVTLLPINVWRAIEVTRLTRRVRRAQADSDLAGLWLKPHMKPRKLKAGQVLFARGDVADRLYLLVDGEMELAELGARLPPGRVFGEIALFSPSGLRTQTVRCLTDCRVLEIHEEAVKALYFQNPAFGFHLMELLVGRLSADVERTRDAALARPQAADPAAD